MGRFMGSCVSGQGLGHGSSHGFCYELKNYFIP